MRAAYLGLADRYRSQLARALTLMATAEPPVVVHCAGGRDRTGIACGMALAAKRDGRWDAAYDSPSTAVVPDDLERALRRNKRAREFFATLSASNRYAILYRIQDAKRPETRARRIAQFVELLARGEKPS